MSRYQDQRKRGVHVPAQLKEEFLNILGGRLMGATIIDEMQLFIDSKGKAFKYYGQNMPKEESKAYLSFYLPDYLYEDLCRIMRRVTFAAFIRALIKNFINKEKVNES